MSFSGLSMALSSMIAQRQALEVTGQNIANANTKGYTRQRADMLSIEALSAPSMHSAGLSAGNGVKVSGITRIGDIFLDARVRSETSGSSFQAAQAKALNRLQSTLTEPSDTSVAAQLAKFWAGWQDVANSPDDAAARNVLIGQANALVGQITTGYRATETQWSQMRTEASTLVTEVNTTAQAVAHLNEQIRSITVSGGSANELADQRDLLITKLSGLVGAEARHREDGTVDVMVAGNALVRGISAKPVALEGSVLMEEATVTPPTGDQVRLVWANSPDVPLNPQGGTLASHLVNLAPGGLLASAANSWNELATTLGTMVNAQHATGVDVAGNPGGAVFAFAPGAAAAGMSVAITNADQIAAGSPGQGAFDGSAADAMSQLANLPGGPDAFWRAFVVDIGVKTQAADQRATVTAAARATAENLQLSTTSVDLDEESINMLAYQRAYEGAARVLTTIDEMLDVLINRTGRVGR
ncbi:flagellar hook-associated protein FlgK [Actinotalea sp. BY-33]|uniref:Flagellar hook-associated protein 1 n=1 Tax=Actinotalea soli TaxID=2819234 RepID=A0A939LPG5_9CELL|nr:flagellar hook-associated protein FlgK [Actinotalea soli]MBO1751248.1 flagellar hook-associated protein FlgK [Actinotalea soli]